MRHTTAYVRTVILKAACLGLCVAAMGGLMAVPAAAHELWIETGQTAQSGAEHAIEICWGHSGERAGGPALAAMADKLSATITAPDGSVTPLELVPQQDCYAGKAKLAASGLHVVGAVLETGIVGREVHGIPANTRIVMSGRAYVEVGRSQAGLANTAGSGLEIALLENPGDLRPGRIVAAKVLFEGKPLGGRSSLVSLGTAGKSLPAEDSEVDECQWVIEAHAHPKTGEVRFPLIAAGRHVFLVRYLDETPGRYDGDLDFGSDFSHLRKGDTYERTMYVATLTFDVAGE